MTLILSGTNGLSDVDGDASTPAVRGTDANTGIFFPAADTIAFAEGGAEAMRIDSSGNLNIGTNSSFGGKISILKTPGTAFSDSSIAVTDGSNVTLYIGNTSTTASSIWTSDLLSFGTGADAFTERARITSDGRFLVGTTTPLGANTNNEFRGTQTSGGTGILSIYNFSSSGADSSPPLTIAKAMTTTTSSARFIQFYANADNTAMGGIVGNGASNVQFASISDVREKTNITPINGSLEKVIALKPVEFDWIANGEHCPAGFVAQDVEQVFPEFVIENFAQEDQEPRKGLTGGMTGGIVAHLVKAIQELSAKNDALEARIAALETGV
jgi:hypothetical protein